MRALLAAVLAVAPAAAHYWDAEAQNQQVHVYRYSVYPYLSRLKKIWIPIKRESE